MEGTLPGPIPALFKESERPGMILSFSQIQVRFQEKTDLIVFP